MLGSNSSLFLHLLSSDTNNNVLKYCALSSAVTANCGPMSVHVSISY